MEVIITGATGFVGINLTSYLKDSHVIHPLSVRYESNQAFELKGDAIIHLAGKAHDLKKVSSPQDYYEANFELTKQLFDGFLTSNASKFIFLSTVKAVADTVDGILSENSIPDPKTHYGIAKHQAEQYILSKKIPDGKQVYILRPCMIHGPGNKGNLNLLYQIVSKGFPWPLGSFENKRSFLSIENLCFIIKRLIENKDVPSGVYHLADDEPLSTNDLIRLIGRTLDKKSLIWKLPLALINFIAKVGNYLNLPLNTERLQKLTESYIVSNTKIRKVLNEELPITTTEGLVKTILFFKNNR